MIGNIVRRAFDHADRAAGVRVLLARPSIHRSKWYGESEANYYLSNTVTLPVQ
jgi:hypothetical protein